MKKIASLLLTVALLAAMLTVFAVPAFAAEDDPQLVLPQYGEYEIKDDCSYLGGIVMRVNSKLTIDHRTNVEISYLLQLDSNTTLVLGTESKLTGKDLYFTAKETAVIQVVSKLHEKQAIFDLTFVDKDYADRFAAVLTRSGVSFTQDGCRVTNCCDHKDQSKISTTTTITTETQVKTTTTVDKYCDNCGQHYSSETKTEYAEPEIVVTVESDNSGVGSILSGGSLTIICTVAAAVIFGLGGFILGRKKKKTAPAGGENTDEE